MSITYTYEIVAVDEAARVMEVVYTAEGHPTQHIGARLPYEGESLEAVIEMYSPVRFWEELQLAVVAPAVGTKQTVYPVEKTQIEETEEELNNKAMWDKVAFEQQISEVLVKFGVLESDPTTIEVSQL